MPKKVLFVLPTVSGGGAERVVLNLLRYLDRGKYDLTLLLFKREGVYWDEIPNDIKVVYATSRGHRYVTFPWVLLRLFFEARRHDIIIAGLELLPTYLSYLAGRLANRPVIGWVHTNFGTYIHCLSFLHRPLLKYVYPRLAKVVFVSDGALVSMRRLLENTPFDHFMVIPNVLDLSVFKYKPKDVQIPDKMLQMPVVCSMGRFTEQKGFDILLKAHAAVLKRGLVHNLLILGDGPLRSSLDDLVASLGISETVFMPGFTANPIPWLKKSQLFVLSSRLEGLPTVLLEAMAVGVPVIATDCPSGPAEILAGGEYGMLVPREDPQALADAMISLLSDQEQLAKYAKKSKQRVLDYSPEKITAQWDKLIGDLV